MVRGWRATNRASLSGAVSPGFEIPDDLESLEETLSILSDPVLAERIREGAEAVERGDTITLDELKFQLEQKRAA